MEEKILELARWEYAIRPGYISKIECVKKAIYESGKINVRELLENLRPFDISINEYIEDLSKKI